MSYPYLRRCDDPFTVIDRHRQYTGKGLETDWEPCIWTWANGLLGEGEPTLTPPILPQEEDDNA